MIIEIYLLQLKLDFSVKIMIEHCEQKKLFLRKFFLIKRESKSYQNGEFYADKDFEKLYHELQHQFLRKYTRLYQFFQHQIRRKMQSFFDNQISTQFFMEQTKRLNDVWLSQSDNNKILQCLYDQNQVIQKLLQNQMMLAERFKVFERYQTTDSEYQRSIQQENEVNQSDIDLKGNLERMKKILFRQKKQQRLAQKQPAYQRSKSLCRCPKEQIKLRKRFYIGSRCQGLNADQIEIRESNQKNGLIRIFMKAMSIFVKHHHHTVLKILEQNYQSENDFNQWMKTCDKKIVSNEDLEDIWRNREDQNCKIFRIISNICLKKHYLSFGQNIKKRCFKVQIKQKMRLMNILKNSAGLE